MAHYNQVFFDYISKGSTASANVVVPLLLQHLNIQSVLDVGCGAGAWLKVWKTRNVEIFGLDGDYVNVEHLHIEQTEFEPTDLRKPFRLGRQFDLVCSLEVAEHLPAESAEQFVQSLCSHAGMVLFSAAPPGQGGDNHINEQPYEYWREKFKKFGYYPHDFIRPFIATNSNVEPWYRYNTILYINLKHVQNIQESISKTAIAGPVPDISPLGYRIRKFLIRMLPVSVVTALAKLKEHYTLARYRRENG